MLLVNTVERTKRKLQHLLDDDDLDLIEENLGVKIKRKKHSRLKTVSSDEDESCEIESDTVSGQHIAYELFGDEEDYDGCAPVRRAAEPVIHPVTEADEGSEESDVDDFIVDDNNEPINKPHVPGQRKKSKGDEWVEYFEYRGFPFFAISYQYLGYLFDSSDRTVIFATYP